MNQSLDNVLTVFPTTIFQSYIEENTDILKTNKHFIYSAQSQENYKVSTGQNFRILEGFPNIRDILLKKFKQFAFECLNYNVDFMITTSWVTITDPQKYMESGSQYHLHKNSFYSGVYYYDEYDGDTAPLEFLNPLEYHKNHLIVPSKDQYNILNGDTYCIRPKKKILLLFPSYLKHKVGQNTSNKTRLSLAFNIVPVGSYGHGDSSMNSNWLYRPN